LARDLVLYALHLPVGGLDQLGRFTVQNSYDHISSHGADFIAIIAIDNKFSTVDGNFPKLYRDNIGYDFGSWNYGLTQVDLKEYEQVIFLNSSIVGPNNSDEVFWNYFLNTDVDFLAVTESDQIEKHYQSYLWKIQTKFAASREFRDFMNKPLTENSRESAIQEKELRLRELMQSMKISHKAIFPSGSVCYTNQNPSLDGWEKLLNSGFPYIKKAVIDEKPYLKAKFQLNI